MLVKKPFSVVYVAKPDYLKELCEEVEEVSFIIENLVFSPRQIPDLCFALDIWFDPVVVEFTSISEAASILRQAGRFWFLNPLTHLRRSHLIEEQIRKLPPLQRSFPLESALPEIGCFGLLDKNTLVHATKRWKKWPLGHCQFIEDKKNPPNRAYLKLWEALSLCDFYPKKGETALDLGASPGGWTYVMQTLGTEITAVDKAPLDPRIANLPGVSFLKQSAFALDPFSFDKKVDWLLCDIACYPERLYNLLNKWLAADKAKHYIFTIKLQGETKLELLKLFKAIPNSRTLHLFHNKHEATFLYPAPTQLTYSSCEVCDD
jgi:23S rRNA (cytidine2498-2'-O)-methyltransferase